MMFSLNAMEKIAKKNGAKRISKNAVKELNNIAEDLASDITLKVIKVSQHSNRLTVLGRDVDFCMGVNNDK